MAEIVLTKKFLGFCLHISIGNRNLCVCRLLLRLFAFLNIYLGNTPGFEYFQVFGRDLLARTQQHATTHILGIGQQYHAGRYLFDALNCHNKTVLMV